MTEILELKVKLTDLKQEIRVRRLNNIKDCKRLSVDIDIGYVRVIRTMEKLVDNMLEEVNGCK